MGGDGNRRNEFRHVIIQSDVYGHAFEAAPTQPERSHAPTASRGVSRRELLKRAGAAAGAAAVPVATPGAVEALAGTTPTARQPAPPEQNSAETFETLTAAQFDLLDAICARLIPTDTAGPGAREARAAHFIDRALSGPLVAFRDSYYAGLGATDDYARAARGAAFVDLSPSDQDAVLTDMESDVATGFGEPSSAFFRLVRAHTIQGMFCDPYHGGNAGMVGWDLIRYPGVRLVATPDDQRMDRLPEPNRRSAYDYPMFTTRGNRGRSR